MLCFVYKRRGALQCCLNLCCPLPAVHSRPINKGSIVLPVLQVLVYHEAIRDDLRAKALNTWLAPPTAGEQPMILVCTDRTSRGIDSMWCEHVVLFEFPRDPSEYVRRVGRTARGADGKGVVSVLVLGKQVPLAKDILERNRQGVPVHRVPRLWSDRR